MGGPDFLTATPDRADGNRASNTERMLKRKSSMHQIMLHDVHQHSKTLSTRYNCRRRTSNSYATTDVAHERDCFQRCSLHLEARVQGMLAQGAMVAESIGPALQALIKLSRTAHVPSTS